MDTEMVERLPFITPQNGGPRAVLQDPESYERMKSAIDLMKLLAQGAATCLWPVLVLFCFWFSLRGLAFHNPSIEKEILLGDNNLFFLEFIEWFDETGREIVHRIPEQ